MLEVGVGEPHVEPGRVEARAPGQQPVHAGEIGAEELRRAQVHLLELQVEPAEDRQGRIQDVEFSPPAPACDRPIDVGIAEGHHRIIHDEPIERPATTAHPTGDTAPEGERERTFVESLEQREVDRRPLEVHILEARHGTPDHPGHPTAHPG